MHGVHRRTISEPASQTGEHLAFTQVSQYEQGLPTGVKHVPARPGPAAVPGG